MSKLSNIINGWKNLIITNETFEPLFIDRLNICNNCDSNISGICKECGCVLIAKTRALYEQCPLYKWKIKHYSDGEFEYILKEELPENLQQYFFGDEIEWKLWQEFLEKGINEDE